MEASAYHKKSRPCSIELREHQRLDDTQKLKKIWLPQKEGCGGGGPEKDNVQVKETT